MSRWVLPLNVNAFLVRRYQADFRSHSLLSFTPSPAPLLLEAVILANGNEREGEARTGNTIVDGRPLNNGSPISLHPYKPALVGACEGL